MKLMHGVIFAVFAAGFQTILAATLMMNYDANDPNSWADGVLKDTVGKGEPLVASGGKEGADYGAPVHVAEGAGPASRAYFDFQKFGCWPAATPKGACLTIRKPSSQRPDTRWKPTFGFPRMFESGITPGSEPTIAR